MTGIVTMPPIFSAFPSDETDEDVAFKVLNQDNLPISIIGDAILPFGRDNYKSKPNALVQPTRRIVTNLEDNKSKSISHINNNSNDFKNERNLRNNFSNSYNHLNHTNSASKFKLEELKNTFDAKFTKTLDAKLRKLQKEEKSKKRLHQPIIQDNGVRKPFVTAVKKGEFLEPPPEIASLIGYKLTEEKVGKSEKIDEKKLYAYASQPRVLNRSPTKFGVHQSRCEAAARAAAKIAGTVIGIDANNDIINNNATNHNYKKWDTNIPYANLMFEKRVFRGSNFAPNNNCHMQPWNPHFAYAKLLSRDEGDGESAAARAAEARRRALARRKAKNQQKVNDLRLGSPPAVPGRRHERIQTEMYLEEIFVSPPMRDTCTQTDLFLERPVSPVYVPAKTGADVETQIYPGDLFDFDLEVQPILDVLVGKTVEQALIEVLDEEELAALREQQRLFLEKRAAEAAEAQRLEEREKRLQQEKTKKIAEMEEGLNTQKEMEERIAASVLMQGYMADLLPSVLEGLKSEGFLMDNIKQDIDEAFMPWLVKEVSTEMQEMITSRDILTDIVREILENRAEIYKALNKETPEEEEEEGPTMEELVLQDHLRLQEEIKKGIQNTENAKENV